MVFEKNQITHARTHVHSPRTPKHARHLNVAGLRCWAQIQTRECSIIDPDAPASGDTVLHCPISCVGHWSSWGACSVTCGTGGTRKRIFAVETQPKYGGDACPISQTNGCNGVDDCVCPRTCIAIGYSCDDWMSTSDAYVLATFYICTTLVFCHHVVSLPACRQCISQRQNVNVPAAPT